MKNLGKLVLAGLAATLCLSAAPASKNEREISMAKCTRDQAGGDMQGSDCQSGCDGSQNCDSDECDMPKEKKPRKSAAKCVMEGD